MEQLDNVVKTIQSKALIAVYMNMKTDNEPICERVRGYMEAIEIINKEFQTHYESFGLEAIAQKLENLKDGVLKVPLTK